MKMLILAAILLAISSVNGNLISEIVQNAALKLHGFPKLSDIPSLRQEIELSAIFDYENSIIVFKDPMVNACYIEENNEAGRSSVIRNATQVSSFCGSYPIIQSYNKQVLKRVHRNRRKRNSNSNTSTRFGINPLIKKTYVIPETGQQMIMIPMQQYYELIKTHNYNLNGFRIKSVPNTSHNNRRRPFVAQEDKEQLMADEGYVAANQNQNQINIDKQPPTIPKDILSSGSLQWDSSNAWVQPSNKQQSLPYAEEHDGRNIPREGYNGKLNHPAQNLPVSALINGKYQYQPRQVISDTQSFGNENPYKKSQAIYRPRNIAYASSPQLEVENVKTEHSFQQLRRNRNMGDTEFASYKIQADSDNIASDDVETLFPPMITSNGRNEQEEVSETPETLRLDENSSDFRRYSDYALQGQGQEFRSPVSTNGNSQPTSTYAGIGLTQPQQVENIHQPNQLPAASTSDSVNNGDKPKCCLITFTCTIIPNGNANQWKRICRPKQESSDTQSSGQPNANGVSGQGNGGGRNRVTCCCCKC